jgi:hypothetical protein
VQHHNHIIQLYQMDQILQEQEVVEVEDNLVEQVEQVEVEQQDLLEQ